MAVARLWWPLLRAMSDSTAGARLVVRRARATSQAALAKSTTLYVGNLSFYTSETQILTLFSQCGDVRRVIMGLDRFKKTPCGFAFVEYYTRQDAEDCIRLISGTRLDDRIIRCDFDIGFTEGRQARCRWHTAPRIRHRLTDRSCVRACCAVVWPWFKWRSGTRRSPHGF